MRREDIEIKRKIIPEIFIENVNKVLESFGYSLSELERISGVGYATIHKLLSGTVEEHCKKRPELETCARICMALNIDLQIAVMQRVDSVHELITPHVARAQMNGANRPMWDKAQKQAEIIFKGSGLKVDWNDNHGRWWDVRFQLFDIHVDAARNGVELSLEDAMNKLEISAA